MKNYLIVHNSSEQAGSGSVLNSAYEVQADYGNVTPDLDAVGMFDDLEPAAAIEAVAGTVGAAMFADTPIIRVCAEHAKGLLSSAFWKVSTGVYEDEPEKTVLAPVAVPAKTAEELLVEDCTAIGIAPAGATLDAKITDAQTKLALLITA